MPSQARFVYGDKVQVPIAIRLCYGRIGKQLSLFVSCPANEKSTLGVGRRTSKPAKNMNKGSGPHGTYEAVRVPYARWRRVPGTCVPGKQNLIRYRFASPWETNYIEGKGVKVLKLLSIFWNVPVRVCFGLENMGFSAPQRVFGGRCLR